ncbi:MAG: hypothetical protein L0229_23810 [Blastocatellia bacterium]|nr:hypothetical protein [Blastocatellia bacterium]
MRDEEFLERFEDCTFPKENFHHQDHVRLAWLYLRSHSLPTALVRFSESLKRFASAHGKEGLYHETITWAYVFLIHERMMRGESGTWEEFARNNPDLLDWKASVLGAYYREETLRSELAKRIFVFPDKHE